MAGNADSLVLDLHAQHVGFERDGQWRFTPPTHCVLAFSRALDELEAEGGVDGRRERYAANLAALVTGMEALGFEPLLPPAVQVCAPHDQTEASYNHSTRMIIRTRRAYPNS